MLLYSPRTSFYCGPVGLKSLGPPLLLCFCLGLGFRSAPLATKIIIIIMVLVGCQINYRRLRTFLG